MATSHGRLRRGFTLIEVAAVCAVVAVLAALALPSYQAQLLRAGRADAVEALTRVQLAQAQHHALHGLYATDLAALRGVPQPLSPQGRYTLALLATDAEGYRATASALPGSRQAGDHDCTTLSLEIVQGFARIGPSARCWNQ